MGSEWTPGARTSRKYLERMALCDSGGAVFASDSYSRGSPTMSPLRDPWSCRYEISCSTKYRSAPESRNEETPPGI